MINILGKTKTTRLVSLVVIAILLVWIIYGFVVIYTLPDWPERGTFGDMFGAINALFSGLALAGIILAIFLQKQELELQRHELELTRQELARTAEAQEQSREALRTQAYTLNLSAQVSAYTALLEDHRSPVGAAPEHLRQLKSLLEQLQDKLDYEAAVQRWAADQGHASAQYNLGAMYHQGKGVTQNYGAAVQWYCKAADQGEVHAQHNLGDMYRTGQGVTQDSVQACMWFSLAAALGDNGARYKRNDLEEKMTPAQIAEAQRLAREWKPKGK